MGASSIRSKFMNIRKFHYLCSIIVLSLFCNPAFSQDFRSDAMGGTGLVLNHAENRLSIYNLTGNPALIMQDEAENWLKMYTVGDYSHGNLHRTWDPASTQNLLFNFQGYKRLNDSQAFYGQVNYAFNDYYSVQNAIELNPYADDPLVLTDTTTGSFRYDGPSINVGYQYQVNKKMSLGANLNYDISQGLKKQFTRPRILHRDFAATAGLGYAFNGNWTVAGDFTYQILQDQTEITSHQLEGLDPRIKRFRSELLFRQLNGSFNRYTNWDVYEYNVALHNQNNAGTFQQLAQADYRYTTQKTFDETSLKVYDSDWYGTYYNGSYQNRWLLPEKGLTLGARISGGYLSSFSEHPTLHILITEREVKKMAAELGVARQMNIGMPILWALQGGYALTEDSYDDYQSVIHRKLKANNYIARAGLDVTIDPIHDILLGYNYGDNSVDVFSPRYLPDYTLQRFSLGITEARLKYNMQLSFEYFVKKARDANYEYDGWMVTFYTKILN